MDVLSKPSVPSGLFKANGVDYLLPPTERVGIMANDGLGNLSWGPSPYPSVLENGDFLNWPNGTSFPAASIGTETARNAIWQTAGAGVVTISRSTDVPALSATSPTTPYSLLVTPTTIDVSIGAGDLYFLQMTINGARVRALTNGFAFSFLVKAHLTGTYCVAFINSGSDRVYVAEYTVSAADTWEYKVFVIPAPPTTGTWDYTLAGTGLRVIFALAIGSSAQQAAGSWQTTSGGKYASANQVNVLAATANTWQVALVNPVPGAQPYPLSALNGMLFSDAAVTTQAFGDTPSPGSGNGVARDTHRHGMPPGTFTVWTITSITQAASTPAFTTNCARAAINGKQANIQCAVSFTGAGTAGSVIIVTLPAGLTLASNGATCLGVFFYNDVSVTIYTGNVFKASATTLEFLVSGNGNFLGATPNFAIASGDTLSFDLTVELA